MQTKFTEIASRITTIKSDLAEAISEKGVITTSDDTFSTIIKNIGNISAGKNEEPIEEWVKPHDWIDIEEEPLETGEVRVLMCDLFGADNNSIYFARRIGATHIKANIDWGDGTIEEVNVTSGSTTINHTFIGNGTPCDRGYNQYVVRIRFNESSSAPNHMYFYRNGATSTNPQHNNLLWIYGDMQYFTNLSNMTCYTTPNYSASILLERLNIINTNNTINMKQMLYNCYSLQSIPQLDIVNVSSIESMFYNCYLLQVIPPLKSTKVTSINYVFNNCYSLKEIVELDLTNLTLTSNVFNNCYSLQSIPQLDTSKVTNMAFMFNNCYSLQSIPQLDTSKVYDTCNMFINCFSLKTIPQLNTSNATNTTGMFSGCVSLKTIPQLDTSKSKNVSYMFSNCRILKKANTIDTRNVTSATNNISIFGNCDSLCEIEQIVLSKDIQLSITSRALMKIDLAYDETDIPVFTQTVPIKINYTQLSADELNKLMTQLPDGNGKTLDLKYNRGSLECDPSIATVKNWTVLVK